MGQSRTSRDQTSFQPERAIRFWLGSPTFAALRNRYYRWLWLGDLSSSAMFQMGMVAQGWLVYSLTGSAFALSWVSAGWSVSMFLFSPYGGVICDRVDKRKLIVWGRVLMVLSPLFIALLISFGVIRVWHLALSSLLNGVIFSFVMPAQQTIVAELVERRTLLNAFSLSSIGMGLMGILSSWVAGSLIDTMGAGGVYYIMVVLQVITLLAVAHLPNSPPRKCSDGSVWRDLLGGVRYIAGQPILVGMLILALARVLFAMPYSTFMPKFAKEVMGFEATGLGLLVAAPSVGSLISSLALASLGDYRSKGKLFLASGMVMGIFLIFFVNVRFLPLLLLLLAVVGAASNVGMVANQTLLQAYTADQFRGRVMSLYMMMWGLTPLGTLPAGALADRVGVPVVVALEGALLMATFLGIALLRSEVKRLE